MSTTPVNPVFSRVLFYTVDPYRNAIFYHHLGLIHALEAMGHTVIRLPFGRTIPVEKLDRTDVVVFPMHPAYFGGIDLELLRKLKVRDGTRIVVSGQGFGLETSRWTHEHENAHPPEQMKVMESGLIDLCYTWYPEPGRKLYFGPWAERFGIPVVSLPLAADATVLSRRIEGPPGSLTSEVGFVGGIWSTKEAPLQRYLMPVLDRFSHTLVGKGWDRYGYRCSDLPENMDHWVHGSCLVCPNVQQDSHRELPGMPCNERTFKIPAGGGFQICDPNSTLRSYFAEDEVPMAENETDFIEKVAHFIRHPGDRVSYIDRAKRKVLEEHTYHHRVAKLLDALRIPHDPRPR